jgi:hypothetical protein
MPTHLWHATISATDGDLLKDKAIGSNTDLGVDDDAVGVWYQQSATDSGIDGYVSSAYGTPESVPEYGNATQQLASDRVFAGVSLVITQAGQQ